MRIIKSKQFTQAMLVSSTASELYSPWLNSVHYQKGDRVLHGSSFSTRVFEALVNNTGVEPDTDALTWVDVGPSNIYAMFDNQVSTMTKATDSLTVVLSPGYITSVCLFGLVGSSVDITLTVDGQQMYHKHMPLELAYVGDWFDYFFAESELSTEVIVQDVPPYYNCTLSVTITGTGTVGIGHIVVGKVQQVGLTNYGATFGIVSYSKKDTDEFGVTTFVKRPFAARATMTAVVDNSQLLKLRKTLYDLEATPAVYIGADSLSNFQILTVFGFFKDFTVTIPYATESTISLEIEGLT